MNKKIKILCTIGPGSRSPKVLRGLIRNGADGLRINLSHTSPAEALSIATDIRKISKTFPIILDTQGKEVRIRHPHGGMELKRNSVVRLSHALIDNDPESLQISRLDAFLTLKKGDVILIDDGNIKLKVVSDQAGKLAAMHCIVLKGNFIKSPKNIKLAVPFRPKTPLTIMDKRAIRVVKKANISEVSLSYAANAKDVREVRKFAGRKAKISAKIETMEAVKNLDEIIGASDAVYLDRNDLGTEIGYERIPLVQKFVIDKCNRAKKPVFVATHLLETMIQNEKPTRAEVNDVINTVLDGADGLILAAETAVGKHPVKALKTLKRLIAQAQFALRGETGESIRSVVRRLEELNYI